MAALASPSRPARPALAANQQRRRDALRRQQEAVLRVATPRAARKISAAFLRLERSAVHGPEIKAITYPLTYSQPAYDEFAKALYSILVEENIAIGNLGKQAAETQLGITLAFDLNERNIPKGLIARRVTGVIDTTKRAINQTIKQGIDDGVHPSVIAKRMRDQLRGYAGLEDLTASRAYTIARTETAMAFNVGSLTSYRNSGLVRFVEVQDGANCGWITHNDPDRAQGKIVTLDEAGQHPLAHPNCLRAFAPVAAGLEPEGTPQTLTPPQDLYANPKDFGDEFFGYGTAEGEQWANQIYDGALATDELTAEMRTALSGYQGVDYHEINDWLRQKLDSEYLTTYENGSKVLDIARVEEAISETEQLQQMLALDGGTPEAVHVWRGFGSGRWLGLDSTLTPEAALERAKALIGTVQVDDGFLSTAMRKEAAFGGFRLDLTVPKGYPSMPVSNAALGRSGLEGLQMGEAELLLQRGSRILIEGVEITTDRYGGETVVLRGRVLPEPSLKPIPKAPPRKVTPKPPPEPKPTNLDGLDVGPKVFSKANMETISVLTENFSNVTVMQAIAETNHLTLQQLINQVLIYKAG